MDTDYEPIQYVRFYLYVFPLMQYSYHAMMQPL